MRRSYTIPGRSKDGQVAPARGKQPRDPGAGRNDMDQWRRGGLVVRDAVIGDLDAIAKLERDSFPEDQVSRRAFAYAPARAGAAGDRGDDRRRDRRLCLDRPQQGRTLGAHLFHRGRSALRSPRRRRGPARGGGEISLCATSARPLTLEVRYDNAPAIALYEKCGLPSIRRARGLLHRRRDGAALQESPRRAYGRTAAISANAATSG